MAFRNALPIHSSLSVWSHCRAILISDGFPYEFRLRVFDATIVYPWITRGLTLGERAGLHVAHVAVGGSGWMWGVVRYTLGE